MNFLYTIKNHNLCHWRKTVQNFKLKVVKIKSLTSVATSFSWSPDRTVAQYHVDRLSAPTAVVARIWRTGNIVWKQVKSFVKYSCKSGKFGFALDSSTYWDVLSTRQSRWCVENREKSSRMWWRVVHKTIVCKHSSIFHSLCKALTTAQPIYLHSLISVQLTSSTRSSIVILSRSLLLQNSLIDPFAVHHLIIGINFLCYFVSLYQSLFWSYYISNSFSVAFLTTPAGRLYQKRPFYAKTTVGRKRVPPIYQYHVINRFIYLLGHMIKYDKIDKSILRKRSYRCRWCVWWGWQDLWRCEPMAQQTCSCRSGTTW